MEITLLRQILAELELITQLLAAAVFFLVLGALCFGFILGKAATLRRQDAAPFSTFKRISHDLYDCGEYAMLEQKCQTRLGINNEDKWARFYLALSYLRLNKYADARAHLNHIVDHDPSWDETVSGYLAEIEAKLSENKPTSV